MKKNWILPIVVLFIAVNVVTYLFAQGRVKIIEKVVTVYKDAKEYLSPIESYKEEPTENKAGQEAFSVKNSSKQTVDFNDTDYLPRDLENLPSLASETPKVSVNQDTPASSEKKREQAVIVFPKKAIKNTNLVKIPAAPVSLSTDTPEQLAQDDSVPMPQLPLIDSDFENDTDPLISNGIQLPELPDII